MESLRLEAHYHVELLAHEHRDVGVASSLVEGYVEALVLASNAVEYRCEAHEFACVRVADSETAATSMAARSLACSIGQPQNLTRVA